MKKQLQISYEQFKGTESLSGMDQDLLTEAWSISRTAYAPYSEFKVGAALRLKSGEVITGSNQENIAYPSGLCAERVALFFAGANFPDQDIETIAIVAEGALIDKESLISPCGSCRQVMIESEHRQNKPIKVILMNSNEDVVIFESVKDLLPLSFSK